MTQPLSPAKPYVVLQVDLSRVQVLGELPWALAAGGPLTIYVVDDSGSLLQVLIAPSGNATVQDGWAA